MVLACMVQTHSDTASLFGFMNFNYRSHGSTKNSKRRKHILTYQVVAGGAVPPGLPVILPRFSKMVMYSETTPLPTPHVPCVGLSNAT